MICMKIITIHTNYTLEIIYRYIYHNIQIIDQNRRHTTWVYHEEP